MTPERWQKIEQLCDAALERKASQRAAFLAHACQGDDELRHEVESLLAQEKTAQGFLKSVGAAVSRRVWAKMQGADGGQSMVGRQLGSYQVISLLGIGGMGEVYEAHDTKLGRDVAIKVLPSAFEYDPERLGRFRREARMLAALNHPNIATIYGLEESEGVHYLVMELVPGQTLAERIGRGALPLPEAQKVAAQIAEALGAAHGKGIIHRDLKPANIKLTPESRVKVLDFGLAKAFAGEGARDASGVPTLTLMGTEDGRILGTPAYMSPEQARGKPVDQRTDIWAFGCLLYEMLTGRPPFPGDTIQDTIAAVLERDPNWQTLSHSTPAKIRDLLRRCLEKDCEQRLPDLAVVRTALETALANSAPTRSKALAFGAIYVGVACILLLMALGIWRMLLRTRSDLPAGAPQIQQITGFPDSAVQPALSPDGKMLAFIRGPTSFVTPGQVYMKLLPNGEPVALTHDDGPKMSPVFSPDGTRIVYTLLTKNQSWDTWAVPVLGGDARPLLSNASGLNWTGTQRLLFSEIKSGIHMALVAANESRTEVRDVYVPEDNRGMVHRSYLSPDAKWVIVVQMDRGGMGPCRLVPFDGGSLAKTAGPKAGQCTFASWSRDGRWMYFSSNASGSFQLWRQRFPDGIPQQLTFGPTTAEGIAMSPDGGSLITSMGLLQRSVWLHENGTERQVSGEGDAVFPAWGDGFPTSVFSPDGKKLYYLVSVAAVRGFGGGELWVKDLTSDTNEAVLPGLAITSYDISPDGQGVAFAAIGQDGKSHLWLARVDRRSAPRQLLPGEAFGPVFGNDDNLYFREFEEELSYIYEIHLASGQVRKAISESAISSPIVSPDGQWIVSSTPFAGQNSSTIVKAYPSDGGTPVVICQACFVKWTRDRRSFLVSFSAGNLMGGSPTSVIKLPPGKTLPILPKAGLTSAADLQKLPVAEVIDKPEVFPGVTSSSYAFVKQVVQRNLYRINLP